MVTRGKRSDHAAEPSAAKKPKVAPLQVEDESLIDTVWEHFSNFMSDEGEVDELLEILDLLEREKPELSTTVWRLPPKAAADSTSCTRSQLLPVLISVVSTLLADAAIAEYMHLDNEPGSQEERDNGSTKETKEDPRLVVLETIRQHLYRALQAFPENAAAVQMATNFVRMTMKSASSFLIAGYIHAADLASRVRQVTIALVHDERVPDAVQEWMVALLLNQVCGVDEEFDATVSLPEEEEDEWSGSKVEGMSRYMAAMVSSMTQQHDVARQQLEALGITHRLHPTVWDNGMDRRSTLTSTDMSPWSSTKENDDNTDSQPISEPSAIPVAYRGVSSAAGGVLPPHLYHRLCAIFHPQAPYWQESDYANRDYYSFFMDVPPPHTHHDAPPAPRNLLDEIVMQHLLPLVQQQPWVDKKNAIVGYEWWVHTRPMAANLGHNLHFDTDEAGLRQRTVSHPLVSSVFYLTGGGRGGTTVVLQQTPAAVENADCAWLSPPVDNSFMMFPGNLLHGVLPCLGDAATRTAVLDTTGTPVDSTCIHRPLTDLLATPRRDPPDPTSAHRLTLMIGFWTHRVPEEEEDIDPPLQSYGPCGALPTTDDAQWVRDLCRGYGDDDDARSGTVGSPPPRTAELVCVPLPTVFPAWEALPTTTRNALWIPPEMDHRFFVVDAPHCFASNLKVAAQSYHPNDEASDDAG
jgi:hypothetical protein